MREIIFIHIFTNITQVASYKIKFIEYANVNNNNLSSKPFDVTA